MVLVEQNVHMALALSGYTYVLAEGRVSIEGNSQDVANMDEVRRAYIGLQPTAERRRPHIYAHRRTINSEVQCRYLRAN